MLFNVKTVIFIIFLHKKAKKKMVSKSKPPINIIDMDSVADPAILSGILGISIPMIYEGRKQSKLPGDVSASYRTCIQQYIAWHKRKSTSKASNIMDTKLLQDIRLGVAKEELTWLAVREQRGEFLDKEEFEGVIGPIFHLLRSGLVALARKNPSMETQIDKLLRTWATLGSAMVNRAESDSKNFVLAMTTKDIDLDLDEDITLEDIRRDNAS